jgi:hypothetical protein
MAPMHDSYMVELSSPDHGLAIPLKLMDLIMAAIIIKAVECAPFHTLLLVVELVSRARRTLKTFLECKDRC